MYIVTIERHTVNSVSIVLIVRARVELQHLSQSLRLAFLKKGADTVGDNDLKSFHRMGIHKP